MNPWRHERPPRTAEQRPDRRVTPRRPVAVGRACALGPSVTGTDECGMVAEQFHVEHGRASLAAKDRHIDMRLYVRRRIYTAAHIDDRLYVRKMSRQRVIVQYTRHATYGIAGWR